MSQPAAKQGDRIIGVDMHIVMVPSASGSVPTSLPHSFSGIIDGGLSTDVRIMGKSAALVGSTASNTPSHIPTPPGTAFQIPPTNKAIIIKGSGTVLINGKPAARNGDQAKSCADPVPNTNAKVVAIGTVRIGA